MSQKEAFEYIHRQLFLECVPRISSYFSGKNPNRYKSKFQFLVARMCDKDP